MSNESDWSIRCKMLSVISNDCDHFKVFANVNEEYYTFILCKDIDKQVNILICLEFTPELPNTQGIYSDILTYSIK